MINTDVSHDAMAERRDIEAVDYSAWQSLPLPARGLFKLVGCVWSSIVGLSITLVVGLFAFLKSDHWLLMIAVSLLLTLGFICFGVFLGINRWKYTQWRLDDEGLHIQRGRWWKSETLVPHSRVQHLDLERGPLERKRGLATLIVHTAGTRLQAVSVPSLLDNQAIELRNAMVPRDVQGDDHDANL